MIPDQVDPMPAIEFVMLLRLMKHELTTKQFREVENALSDYGNGFKTESKTCEIIKYHLRENSELYNFFYQLVNKHDMKKEDNHFQIKNTPPRVQQHEVIHRQIKKINYPILTYKLSPEIQQAVSQQGVIEDTKTQLKPKPVKIPVHKPKPIKTPIHKPKPIRPTRANALKLSSEELINVEEDYLNFFN